MSISINQLAVRSLKCQEILKHDDQRLLTAETSSLIVLFCPQHKGFSVYCHGRGKKPDNIHIFKCLLLINLIIKNTPTY